MHIIYRLLFILSTTASRSTLGLTLSPVQWVPGPLSHGVMRQRRETDHSPPSSVEIKNGGAIPPFPICLYEVVLNY
jgi:hypothetical protein